MTRPPLDAHFADIVIILLEFMKMYFANQITKIQTFSGLAQALSYREGTPNLIVHLIKSDSCRLDKIKDTIKAAVKDGNNISQGQIILYSLYKLKKKCYTSGMVGL